MDWHQEGVSKRRALCANEIPVKRKGKGRTETDRKKNPGLENHQIVHRRGSDGEEGPGQTRSPKPSAVFLVVMKEKCE